MNEDLAKLLSQGSLRLFEVRGPVSRQIIAAVDRNHARKIVGNETDVIELQMVELAKDSVKVEYDQSPGVFTVDLIDIGT